MADRPYLDLETPHVILQRRKTIPRLPFLEQNDFTDTGQ